MPLKALEAVSKGQNGVGAFILQCKRIDVHYCDWAGSSKGMNTFITTHLPTFARLNPSIELHISPRPTRHPLLRGHYINGRQKAVCVKNLAPGQILEKAELLKAGSGEKNQRINKPVASLNGSVRGVWSPFHGSRYRL
ncbi:hypothetical protein K402DRAFT_390332 [Aulographum hederae CBS 113979]|uniref:Large ribosomal subunit protein mL43 n=1 Tax=Aulographum hederae CBS 113979 TaxID=1176131 RepID=A0A6G1HAG2_9PEZI|nr:hypothetical protein K402DRAFT_390332 [Aulographum hederae CBS 113979]